MKQEELNKKAEEAAREVYTYTFQGIDDLIGLFLAGYKLAEKDLGWISVLERLPEPGEWVLVCIDDCGGPQCLSLATYDERTGIWTNDRDEMVHLDYWMPIPGFRKEEEQ